MEREFLELFQRAHAFWLIGFDFRVLLQVLLGELVLGGRESSKLFIGRTAFGSSASASESYYGRLRLVRAS